MKIKYLAHACFLITSETGTRIVTDPYETSKELLYNKVQESADIVTVSHAHFDHNNVAAVKGNPQVIDKPGRSNVKGIEFNGIATYHDEEKGRARGSNIIFCFTVDGIKVCHLGDLGHKLDEKQLAEIGKVDILLPPVGGFFTIDAGTASEIASQINPSVIIPMHYRTEKCKLPINGVDQFLEGKDNIVTRSESEVEFEKDNLPGTTQIVLLQHEM